MIKRIALAALVAFAGGITSVSALGLLLASGCGSKSDDSSADATADSPYVYIPPSVDAQPDDDSTITDGGSDSSMHFDAGDAGHCSPVNGSCDVVLNNCASSNGNPAECVPGSTPDSSVCMSERASQHLPLGHTCCPTNDPSTEPCLPGTQCFGDPCTGDGAVPTARCTARCCDDSVCGKSVPEGIVGSCSLNIVDDNQDVLYSICTYQRPCHPFNVTPCPEGQVCLVTDKLGTASCSPDYFPDGGDGMENDGCNASNSCSPGLGCVFFVNVEPDGGVDPDAAAFGLCVYNCVVPGTTPPFDASPSGAPGYGGCPAGEVCNAFEDPTQPPWFGFCQSQ